MVNYSEAPLDSTFGALSDPTRRGILARLARQGQASIGELAAPYKISLPAVSKHLRVLENARLIARQKDGRVHRCRLVAEPMKDAAAWIEHYRVFWETQLDSLARFLEDSQKPAAKAAQSKRKSRRAAQHRIKKPKSKETGTKTREDK